MSWPAFWPLCGRCGHDRAWHDLPAGLAGCREGYQAGEPWLLPEDEVALELKAIKAAKAERLKLEAAGKKSASMRDLIEDELAKAVHEHRRKHPDCRWPEAKARGRGASTSLYVRLVEVARDGQLGRAIADAKREPGDDEGVEDESGAEELDIAARELERMRRPA